MNNQWKIKALAFTGSLSLLLCLFAVWRGYVTNARMRMDGPIHQFIAKGEDFLADIQPPSGFIVESQLKATELLLSKDDQTRAETIQKQNRLAQQYEEFCRRWQAEMKTHATDGPSRSPVLSTLNLYFNEAYPPGKEFFDVLQQSYLPAIKAGDAARAAQVYHELLRPKFEKHAAVMDQVVDNVTEQLDLCNAELQASTFRFSLWACLVAFSGCVTVCASICIAALYIRKATHETKIVQSRYHALDKAQAVIEFDADGNIVKANDNFLKTLGYSQEEIIGRHHSMFVEPQFASSHEYRQFWNELKSGRSQIAEFKRIGKGGREVWINASYNPISNERGVVSQVIKFATDVTENKLRNADFQGQLDAIGKAQAVIEFDLDGTIRSANANFLKVMGYSLEEIRGKHHSMFVDPAYSSTIEYRRFWDELRAGNYQAAQFQRVGKGGKHVWIQASYNPILDLNGKPYKVVKFATDISAAKEMEFSIAQRQKQDEKDALELREKVKEILEVVAKASQRDYSQKLSVRGSDEIGKLGEGLSEFLVQKEATEVAEAARSEHDRARAAETEHKVQAVLAVVNSVAEGNFNVHIPNMGDDAIGQVASALSAAVDSMKSALIEVRDVAGTVSTAATQLAQASRDISSGAQSQASSLEETASSLEEITSTVKQNTDNAQQARQLATGSRDVAERGGTVVSDAVQAMEQINSSSKKIADIITTIDEIAFQTNLLALNAAVEAARAGEQGRGFAVVAAEVRNLAQRSAGAAKEIKNLIQDSVTKVQNGTELVNKSGSTLSEIVNSVKRVTDIVAEIAAASKEQLSGVEQVNKAVSQMDRVTQGNAAQTEEMSGTANMLLSHAKRLADLVGKFQLDAEQSRRSPQRREELGVEHIAATPNKRLPSLAQPAFVSSPDLLEF